MTVRVESYEVRDVIDTFLEDPQIDKFITTANIIVDNNCDSGLSDDELKQIELYVAAHLVCLRDPRLLEEKTTDWALKYQRGGVAGKMGLEQTSYGQTALMLDRSGGLKNTNASNVIFEAL